MKLTKNEQNLVFFIRNIGFGELRIKVENSQPTRIIKSEQSILLVNLYTGDNPVDNSIDTQN